METEVVETCIRFAVACIFVLDTKSEFAVFLHDTYHLVLEKTCSECDRECIRVVRHKDSRTVEAEFAPCAAAWLWRHIVINDVLHLLLRTVSIKESLVDHLLVRTYCIPCISIAERTSESLCLNAINAWLQSFNGLIDIESTAVAGNDWVA